MSDVVQFFGVNGEYGIFSNFYPATILIDGKVWPTIEHYYQAMKVEGTPEAERIRLAEKPGEAKRLGRLCKMRDDWENVKEHFMRKALRSKFEQHPDFKEVLLETGVLEIVETNTSDSYWGIGPDGRGQNRLGKLLMDLRRELLEAAKAKRMKSDWHPVSR